MAEARRFLRTTLSDWDAEALEWPATQALHLSAFLTLDELSALGLGDPA